MKLKISLLLALAFIITASAVYLLVNSAKKESIVPYVYSVSNNSAIIAFESKTAYRAEIAYNIYLGGAKTRAIIKEDAKTTAHKLYLQGLSPGTKYSYSFPAVSKSEFSFKTKPEANQLFRFGIVPDLAENTELSLSRLRYLFINNPEFLLIKRPCSEQNPQTPQYSAKTAEIKPYLPLFGIFYNKNTASNSYLNDIYLPLKQPYYSFNWGAWHFVSLSENFLEESGEALQNKLQWLKDDLKNSRNANKAVCLDAVLLGNKELNSLLIDSGTDAVFIFSSDKFKTIKCKNTKFISLPKNDFCLIEADYYEASGVILDKEGKTIGEFPVKESSAKVKKTCEYCRQLMDSGRYEDSIKAYRDFIAEKNNSYQVDDAQYEMASIYDRGLYDYKNALFEYRKLIQMFPDSTKKMLAENRTAYITENADFDYKPLGSYEKVKAEFFKTSKTNNGKAQSVSKVEALLAQYPACSLADDMLYWLANNYQSLDYKKSVSLYRKLIAEFPQSPFIQNAVLEIADVFYANKQYRLSIAELQKAKAFLPSDKLSDIEGKISQSSRNIHRYWLAGLCWVIVLGCVACIFFLKPKLSLKDFKPSLIHFLLYFVSYCIVVLLWYDLFLELIPFMAVMVPLISLTPAISGLLTKQLPEKKALFIKLAVNVVLVACFVYISIFHTYIHWLIVFGL
ncbi:MAG: hypothetical protein A2252_04100 [Elusimicrobia bacterium RIFOXYA2_FULL_39_19]|nr:MAG: hypothetical protein A2252_04100 [Elusimicrobia bacterium RIFOXYA2_FULL_39_19]